MSDNNARSELTFRPMFFSRMETLSIITTINRSENSGTKL